jgi:hypothetical protein
LEDILRIEEAQEIVFGICGIFDIKKLMVIGVDARNVWVNIDIGFRRHVGEDGRVVDPPDGMG